MTQEAPTTELPTPAAAVAEEAPAENAAAPEATATEEPAAPEPGPFATITDPYELFDHEAVKPVLERRDRRVEADLRQRLESEAAEAQRGWESGQVARAIGGAVGRILEKLDEGSLDGTDRFVSRLEELVSPYGEAAGSRFRREGAAGAATQFASLLTDGMKNMDVRTQDEFDDFLRTANDWPKILDRYVAAHVSRAEAKLNAKLAEKDQQIEQLKLGVREGQGPNGAATAPSTRGGATISTMDDADILYSQGKISTEEYRAARERFGVKSR